MKKFPPHSKEYVTLRDYFDCKIKAIYHAMDLKNEMVERSTKLAANTLEKRLEHLNQFREALNDQTKHFLTKSEFTIQHDRIIEDIKILRESKAKLEGMASQKSVLYAYIMSGIGLLIGITTIILHFI